MSGLKERVVSREDLLARIAALESVADATRRIVAGVECCKELVLSGRDFDALDEALDALGPRQ